MALFAENSLKNPKLKNDEVLQKIHKQFLGLDEAHVKEHNVVLNEVKLILTQHMKSVDPDFEKTFKRINSSGSFYKKTKFSKPDEFDLNIIIQLPIMYNKCNILPSPKKVSYLTIKITEESLTPKWKETKLQRKLVDENRYLDQDKFRRWIEGVMNKALETIKNQGRIIQNNNKIYKLHRMRKSGPAFTIDVRDQNSSHVMSIDFVPCLEFHNDIPGYRRLSNIGNMTWLAVPKPFLDTGDNLNWRTSFYDYEKEFIKHSTVKQAIKLMKKLRDRENWKCLASYYIETLFYHEVHDAKLDLQRVSLKQLFIYMLGQLQSAFQKKCIPYYWQKNYNLLEKCSNAEAGNVACRIKNILASLYKDIDNCNAIATIILTSEEYEAFQQIPNNITETKEEPPSRWCTIS